DVLRHHGVRANLSALRARSRVVPVAPGLVVLGFLAERREPALLASDHGRMEMRSREVAHLPGSNPIEARSVRSSSQRWRVIKAGGTEEGGTSSPTNPTATIMR